MGKSGDRLRKERKQKARYNFTGEELERQHAALEKEYLGTIMARVKDKADELDLEREKRFVELAEKRWAEKEAEYEKRRHEEFLELITCLMSASCRVLVEQFGWKKARITPGPKTKIEKYADALAEEIEKATKDNGTCVKQYVEETDNLYGFRFRRE